MTSNQIVVRRLTAKFCHNCSNWEKRTKFGIEIQIKGGKFKLIGGHKEINVKTISGRFRFSVLMFASENENVKFLNFRLMI